MSFWVDDVPLMLEAEFSVQGTVDGASTRGIFDSAYDTTPLGMMTVAGTAPVFIVPSAVVPSSAYGKAVTVPDGDYTITEARHDGTGVCTLVLERAL